MSLPPCPHRSLAATGEHKCSLKKIVLSQTEAEEQCWKCEEQDFGEEDDD